MTPAKRPIKRETEVFTQGRKVCVELGQYGIHLWLKGTRTRYQMPYGYAYERAAKLSAGYTDPPADKRRKRYQPEHIGDSSPALIAGAIAEHIAGCAACFGAIENLRKQRGG